MAELTWATITELARMTATKEVSSVDVVRAYLDRIAKHDGALRSYITVSAEAALEAAKKADAELAAGQAIGPLHGVPIALKDLFNTAGVRTTGGSKILADEVPAEDATVVKRLKAAGAIVIGKLNMHEFAYGPEGLNAQFGDVRNPWDGAVHRIAGGSSSGSGAAVAAGLCAGALGSDTGGSIRIPASLCGITGLKVTYGRVSRAGVLPLSWTLDTAGPMARSAADCGVLLGATAGYDPADQSTSVLPVPDYRAALTGDVKGLRIGVLRPWFFDGATEEIANAVEEAAKLFEKLGAKIDEVKLEQIAHAPAAAAAIVACEAAAYHLRWLRTRSDDYQPDVRDRLRAGIFVSGAHYIVAQQVRAMIRDEVDAAFTRRDVLLTPATPISAPPLGQHEIMIRGAKADVRTSLLKFTRPFNLSGHPACSLPCGFAAGLPLGMQIVGRPFDEATVLRAADAYQRATDWHTRRPGGVS
jgi:aspartyl-tRNA(Asn)/glutamyl-tRNA(Gln) amidotransferase subunit A